MKRRLAPPPLSLDFAQRIRQPGWLGGLMLAVGLVATTGVLYEYYELNTCLAEETHRLLRLKRDFGKRQASSSITATPVLEAELKPALGIARILRREWSGLFGSLEQATDDPGVVLLSMDQDGVRGSLKLTGEGRNLHEVFAYIQRLNNGGVLQDVRLASYEFHTNGSVQVVGFAIAARWGSAL